MTDEHKLPEPDDVAMAHSQRLRAVIDARIKAASGVISFSEYMNIALYEPGLGYYMAGAAKFGAQGDFITAPEASPLFGQALAMQIDEVLDAVGGSVLELGAGSGKLAQSILGALCGGDFTHRAEFRYFILEPSAELAQRQQQLLDASLPADVVSRVEWLNALPENFQGVILANEVMDALPVERFHSSSQGLMQVCVGADLTEQLRPASDALTKAIAAIEVDLDMPMAEGYQSEVCTLLAPWVHSVAGALTQGALLLIDYGYPRSEYYSAERVTGTLSCYYRHRMHDDPFFMPGLQDITAHVDFTAVVEAAMACELELLGYASQAAFLLDNELLGLADTVRAGLESEMDRIALAQQIKVLTLPGEMGERFQVMALGKGYDRPLRGFRSQDLSYRL